MLYDAKKWGKPTKPVFGRRWHSFKHLDIRPVLWSLRNRPDERSLGEYKLIHEPSRHNFWIGDGYFHYPIVRHQLFLPGNKTRQVLTDPKVSVS